MTKVVAFVRGGGRELAPGTTMQPLFGDGAMLNLLELVPEALVPVHAHEHEQLGLVLEGELVLTVAGVEHVLHPDDAYQIPGGVEHSARGGPEGARVLDVFRPVREDYRGPEDA